jgi:hypothetical protein
MGYSHDGAAQKSKTAKRMTSAAKDSLSTKISSQIGEAQPRQHIA